MGHFLTHKEYQNTKISLIIHIKINGKYIIYLSQILIVHIHEYKVFMGPKPNFHYFH